MITLPGGIGTLSEMALAWSFLQVGEVNPRPLALLGDMWRDGIRGFYRQDYVKRVYLDLLYFADTPEAAVAYMVRHVKRD
jgi:predicted Rossmann-fold nucleotide-binding protein